MFPVDSVGFFHFLTYGIEVLLFVSLQQTLHLSLVPAVVFTPLLHLCFCLISTNVLCLIQLRFGAVRVVVSVLLAVSSTVSLNVHHTVFPLSDPSATARDLRIRHSSLRVTFCNHIS